MQKYIFEFIGTLFFVYTIINTFNPIAIGCALTILLFLGNVYTSGFFNPAATIALTAKGYINVNDLMPYIVAQIIGALVAIELQKKIKL